MTVDEELSEAMRVVGLLHAMLWRRRGRHRKVLAYSKLQRRPDVPYAYRVFFNDVGDWKWVIPREMNRPENMLGRDGMRAGPAPMLVPVFDIPGHEVEGVLGNMFGCGYVAFRVH